MANTKLEYHFDRFAEFLNVTLAENIARCQLGLNKVHKIRIYLDKDKVWPKSYKVILDNELVANGNTSQNPDASYDIQYQYAIPSNIPKYLKRTDHCMSEFINKAKSIDPEFYGEAWSLSMHSCIPFILKEFAFRNVSQNLSKQLTYQGVALSPSFEVQFYDGENFLSFSYDSLVQQLKQQIQFYLTDPNVKALTAQSCFKHPDNQSWFLSL
ncbi:hypothetical protein NBRC116188_10620 [Oceaniserpentilla sp. 4NH20-0058]|uniref:hypothetical protein n=1 Tax=Oceaniserpentilla sp. 4NH20-0058 TaxID=3127660 RepID=UPI003102AC58